MAFPIKQNTAKARIILGIDPGLADTGFGVIEETAGKLSCLGYGSIKTKKEFSLSARILELEKELEKIIKKYQPDLACVEQLFFCTTAAARDALNSVEPKEKLEYGIASCQGK